MRGKRSAKARKAPRSRQLCFRGMGLKDPTRPRSAPRLGRPRKEGAGVSHGAREAIAKLSPVHATLKTVGGLPSLRGIRAFRVVYEALRAARERPGRLHWGSFRVVHFRVQGNHVHLVVEADGQEALGRGIAGIGIRVAKGINELCKRKGKVWADRYHSRVLPAPLLAAAPSALAGRSPASSKHPGPPRSGRRQELVEPSGGARRGNAARCRPRSRLRRFRLAGW